MEGGDVRMALTQVVRLVLRTEPELLEEAERIAVPGGDIEVSADREMVELESLIDESDIWLVHDLVENHVRFTGSALGRRLLDNWEMMVARFVKVMPTEYKRVLQQRRAQRRSQQTSDPRAIPAE
jgi:glutamate synthase domain-containing protein 3